MSENKPSQNESDEEKLRDSEIAIIDALKMLVEIIIAAGIARPDGLQRLFVQQRDLYVSKNMANAAVVMEVLRTFAQPDQKGLTEEQRRALEQPPQGSA